MNRLSHTRDFKYSLAGLFNPRKRRIYGLFFILAGIFVNGCYRGLPHEDEPIEIIQDMYNQPKYQPQAKSHFFPDSMTMRPTEPGTLAQGRLHEDSAYFTGFVKDSTYVKFIPVHVDMALLERGRERFDIYCSPCHSRVGDGKGIVVQYGFVPPPSYHTDAIRQITDGQIFDVITNGIRTMPSYGNQVQVADRWAIVAYVRALQLSQNATSRNIPPEEMQKLK